jgi:hypothetical protein
MNKALVIVGKLACWIIGALCALFASGYVSKHCLDRWVFDGQDWMSTSMGFPGAIFLVIVLALSQAAYIPACVFLRKLGTLISCVISVMISAIFTTGIMMLIYTR